MGFDVYLNSEVEELDGKKYIEINFWSALKVCFLSNLFIWLISVGGFFIITLFAYLLENLI